MNGNSIDIGGWQAAIRSVCADLACTLIGSLFLKWLDAMGFSFAAQTMVVCVVLVVLFGIAMWNRKNIDFKKRPRMATVYVFLPTFMAGVVLVLLFSGIAASNLFGLGASGAGGQTPKLSYQVHIQGEGWHEYVSDNEIAGTTGKAKRVEAFRVKLTDCPYDGAVVYRSHIQNSGWEKGYKSSGDVSGTTGKALQIEAIEVALSGELADHFDVYYCVHVQSLGWSNWVSNGKMAGTTGRNLRVEALIITLSPKGAMPPNPL